MNIKKICAALLVSTTLLSTAFAAGADDELSIMAAEQRRDAPTETFEHTESQPEPQPVVERPSARPSTPQPAVERPSTTQPTVERPANPSTVERPANTQPSNVGMPNPIVTYNTFDEIVEELGYVPLYIPKSSGYALNYISIIGGTVADLRFGRRWETEVKLVIRTYKRPVGEELKDISGVHGVKWRVDLSSGIPVYLARIDDKSNAAAWSVGQYTFAAMTENLSFAAFRTLVFEELADITTHYYVDVD